MKKFYWIILGCIVVYAVCVIVYFLQQPSNPLPTAYVGSPADPSTFMSGAQIEKAHNYSTIGYLSYFLETPVEWGLYLFILGAGLSVWFRNMTESWFKNRVWRIAAYVAVLMIFISIVHLPIDSYFFRLDHRYGISTQTVGSWISDHLKQLGISLLFTIVMVWLYYWIAGRSPRRWWLWYWLISIPLILFITFIQPVVLDPLFNDFQPLHDQTLKTEILQLAARSNIPANQVYEVNMSAKTNAINAYVNGIGSNMRIVLWDTTLSKLSKSEILFVMAHEMGHYVEHHLYWGLLMSVMEALVFIWVIFHLFRYIIRRWGSVWGVRDAKDMAALPILLLLISIMSFISSPLDNTSSRYFEHRADKYAIQLRGDAGAGVKSFQKIARESLSEVNPPFLAHIFLGSHPSLMDRIDFVEHYQAGNREDHSRK